MYSELNTKNNVSYVRSDGWRYSLYGLNFNDNPYSNLPEGYSIVNYQQCGYTIYKNDISGTMFKVIKDQNGDIVEVVSDVSDLTMNGTFCNVAYILLDNNSQNDTYYINEIVFVEDPIIFVSYGMTIADDSNRLFNINMSNFSGVPSYVVYSSDNKPFALISEDNYGFISN